MTLVSACGLDCEACFAYPSDCTGCHAEQGRPSWLSDTELESCPLYDCPVNQRGYADCGSCPELPCQQYFELRDPSLSPEEHEKGIIERVRLLRTNRPPN